MSRILGAGVGAAVLLLVSAGCASTGTGEEDAAGRAPHAENPFGHVHGLGVNPADDRLYVASHVGVFRETDRGFRRVADRWQDTMSFTVAGPDHFLGSGHPDLREDEPAQLGLIESTDAAQTWTALSLEGKADFHLLEVAGDRLYGYDSQTGTLMVTEDRKTWSTVLAAPLLDLEADPEDATSLVVADQRGELMRLAAGGPPEAIEDAPQLVLLDWPTRDQLVGLGPSGDVWVSRDRGGEWTEAGAVPGPPPQALTTDGETWYAASGHGLFSSSDRGRTWQALPAD